MPRTLLTSATFVAAVTAIALAPPAVGDPMDPIPGNGVFVVGPDIAPGLYHTGGSASTFGVWINNVPTQASMFVVYLQHARCGQGPCTSDEYIHRSDVREHQLNGQGVRVAELSTLDSRPLRLVRVDQKGPGEVTAPQRAADALLLPRWVGDLAALRWREGGDGLPPFSIKRPAWSRMQSRPYSKFVSSGAPMR